MDWILAQFWYPAIGAVAVRAAGIIPRPIRFRWSSPSWRTAARWSSIPRARRWLNTARMAARIALDVPDTDGYRAELEYFLDCAAQRPAAARVPARGIGGGGAMWRSLMLESRSRNGEKIACKF